MDVERRDDMPASTIIVILTHRPNILGGMLVRYRYRIDPTGGQRQALARAFGCARVVYNDALVERQRAYQAGEKLSDTEVQRRVVTLAKHTVERAWLAEVASVVLVQACQDARRERRIQRGPRGLGVVIGLEVEDLDATYAYCTGSGCEITCEPMDEAWGVRLFSCLDPFGYEWEMTVPLRVMPADGLAAVRANRLRRAS